MFIEKMPNLPLYVDLAYMNGNWKYYTMETHSHGLLECNYIAEGSCIYEIDGTDYQLTQKNLILLDSSIPHKIRFNHERPCTVLGFSLSFCSPGSVAFPGLFDILNNSLDICRLLASLKQATIFLDARSLRNDMLRLYHEFEGRKDPLYLTSLSYHLLCEIARLPQTEKSSASYYVEKAENYIKEAFYLIKNNEQIADYIGLNATYLERIYKKATGSTLWEAVTSCRLNAAIELLSQPGIPIHEIDNMIGFANRQTFYLQFKKKFGMSPSEYRRRFSTR
ncbi:MAG: helix-turn-helix domain-containing protein [Lachnospiraceae bacterium]